MGCVAGRFGRVEPRRTARDLVLGLRSPVERKNCWWLAEQAGHRGPQAMQRLLRTAAWDADAVRDECAASLQDQREPALSRSVPPPLADSARQRPAEKVVGEERAPRSVTYAAVRGRVAMM
ncbi:hypothetical protein GCM10023176_57460 [Micromonospora coerulea]|uniref:Transposase IS701-like DDE domain-containing protein n=1 Tax=Micromonospora coerulea TaxID=47856 RepID=A0ABP8T323_9ACTN